MSQVPQAYYALWIAHPILQSGVLLTMWRNKLHKKFPVFFAYIVSEIVMFSICFPIFIKGSYTAFFYAHWILAVVSLGIGFFVIHEVFSDIFRPFHTLKDLGTVLFTWAGFVMLLVAAVVAAASPASHSPIVESVLTLQRCVRVIQCGLVFFLLVFAKYLGVSRKQQSFGIVLGFGSYALVELCLVALFDAGRIGESKISLINTATYNVAILVWLGYCWYGKVASRDSTASLVMSQRWEEGLSDIQHPVPADSLIPMFEGMVERAFSRNQNDVSVIEESSQHSSRRLEPKADALGNIPGFPQALKSRQKSAASES